MAGWLAAAGVIGGIAAIPVVFALAVRIYIKYTMGRCRSHNRLDGKVVIVTGSNSGIGAELAKALAHRGARVIMACRNVQKAEKVASGIIASCPGCSIVVKRLDLCSLTSVRNFADDIRSHEVRIDILINNAGISGGDFKLTEDIYEEIYQANYLGPFYLTELLMPLLKQSAPSRIVNTGSSAYFLGYVDPTKFLNDIKTRNGTVLSRYADTKLAMLMWTKAMAEELDGTGVTINIVHPGVVATPIASHSSDISNLLFRMNILLYGRTAEQGAQTLLHLCLDPIGAELSGQYWEECKTSWVVKANNKTQNAALVEVTRRCLKI